jgi:putative PIN family toxin of toxin-antitoxin system
LVVGVVVVLGRIGQGVAFYSGNAIVNGGTREVTPQDATDVRLSCPALKSSAKQLVANYKRFAQIIPTRKLTEQVCRDADDDAVLACALAAQASLIVTGDKDLRVLHPWRDIHILNPPEALRFIEKEAARK